MTLMTRNGIYKCGNINCDIWNVLYVSYEFQSPVTGLRYHINFKFDCNTINLIYLLPCKTCSMFGPLSQGIVCDLANINRTLNCMVKESKDLNKKI